MSDEVESEFRRWRSVVGYTQQKAADELGVSLSQIKNWDAGEDRGRPGTPSIPPLVVRFVMQEIAKGSKLEPWPAEAARKRRR